MIEKYEWEPVEDDESPPTTTQEDEEETEYLPSKKESNWIELPKQGRLISNFANELINHIGNKKVLFFRPSSRQIVEIGKIKNKDNSEYKYTGFLEVSPNRFITLCERYITPFNYVFNQSSKQWEEKEKSMSSVLSKTILSSHILEEGLPLIDRIFTVPIPIIYEHPELKGKVLTFPKKGYDRRFNSWLPEDSPEIMEEGIKLDLAKEVLEKVLGEFCFKDEQDKIIAISALLTPFLRGLYPSMNCRTPLFCYIGNRERAGKDYLAGITGIIYEGEAREESPISSEDNKGQSKSNEEESRKKLTTSFMSGKKRFHSANNKGYINNATFEGVLTNKKYTDRVLGSNKEVNHDNEMEFSLSGNIGISFTPDLMNRSRFINLHLEIEDANSRKFNNPNLHGWVFDNRDMILSALFTLVKDWYEKGMPKGSVPFTSFPEWAEICGGIMENAGYKSPCKTINNEFSIGGDTETQEIKRLFELCSEQFGKDSITKEEIRIAIINKWRDQEDIFQNYDFDKASDKIKFGNLIKKNVGRIYSDIKLNCENPKERGSRQKFIFIKNDNK